MKFFFGGIKRKELLESLIIILFLVIVSFLFLIYYSQIKWLLLNLPPNLIWLSSFLLGFIGAASIIIPIPYTALFLLLSANFPELDILSLSIFSGIGSGFGELTGWILGYYLTNPLTGKYKKRIETFEKFLENTSEWLLLTFVFLFAFTPLPDDLIFIALGMLRYSLWKAVLSCTTGKILMFLTIGWFGKLLGLSVGKVSEQLVMAVTLVLVILLFLILVVIDWERILSEKLEK